MTDSRRSTGATGEQLAADYLQRKGYHLVARNWRCGAGELDLIMQDGSSLVFVEVRTRRSLSHGSAEESITTRKQQRLITLAETFLAEQAEQAQPWQADWRIDVVAIQLDAHGFHTINHLINAIEA